jgi:hypothetical protein
MDELRMVRDYRDDYPMREPAELDATRDPLAAAMRAERAGRRPAPPRSRRWIWASGAAAGLVAAAVAGAVVLGPVTGAPGGHTGQPSALGGSGTAGPVRAATVLHLAAQAALTQPAGAPRADQYIYTRTSMVGQAGARESWMSVDGTRDGLVMQPESPADPGLARLPIPGCRNGRAAVFKGGQAVPGRTEPCTPDPAYRADLPTDVDAMSAYLAKNSQKSGGTVDAEVDELRSLLVESYTTPAQRAALYEAAARMPGLSAVGDTTDGAGRHGLGVTWKVPTQGGGTLTEALVFDSKTYRLLGTDNTAVLAGAVVDAVGQRG